MTDDLVRITTFFDKSCDDLLCIRSDADMYFISPEAEDRGRPGPAALPVGYHLRLIYHGDIIFFIFICHFNGRSLKSGSRHYLVFFTGI